MPRIRTVKPDFFRDETLQDLEVAHGELKPMLTFEGLWCQSDKAGNFLWNPRVLHLDILPFIEYDLSASLMLLGEARLLSQYDGPDGKKYGHIHNFDKHQRISGKEAIEAAKFPSFSQGSTREAPEKHLGWQEGERVIGERKGEGEIPQELHANQYATRLLEEVSFPVNTQNIKAVASAIECEVTGGKSKSAAYEFLLACTRDAMEEGFPITTFFFTEAKYRPQNRRNGNGQSKPSASVARAERSKENILKGIAADVSRRTASNGA